MHDVARHSPCTGKGTLLPFARFEVNYPGWGDTPPPIPAHLPGRGVSLPCLLSRHLQSCSKLPQETTKKFEPLGSTAPPSAPSPGRLPPRVLILAALHPSAPPLSDCRPGAEQPADSRPFPSASRASELSRTPRGPTGQFHTPPIPTPSRASKILQPVDWTHHSPWDGVAQIVRSDPLVLQRTFSVLQPGGQGFRAHLVVPVQLWPADRQRSPNRHAVALPRICCVTLGKSQSLSGADSQQLDEMMCREGAALSGPALAREQQLGVGLSSHRTPKTQKTGQVSFPVRLTLI